MKRLLMALLLPAVAFFAFAATASAQTFRSGNVTNVAANESLDGSAFMAGSTVDVAGSVNGDLYCAGQTVTITGNIKGDVLCAAQTITISGTVSGDARLAGQTVTITGDIKGNVTAAGQTATIDGAGKIGRDAVLLGQSVTVAGVINRDVTIASNSAVINSMVGRNMSAQVQALTLGSSTDIKGVLDYTSPSTLTRDNGAKVAGKISYTRQRPEQRARADGGFNVVGAIVGWLMLVVSALIFALLFPRELHRTTEISVASPAQALLAVAVGLIAGIVVPIVVFLLMITVFALPFALVLMVGWVLILAVSGVFTAYYLGRVLWRTQPNAILATFIGAAIIATALAVPIINILVWLLVVWYGSGAVLMQLRRLAVAPNYTMSTKKVRGRKR